jgi:hypothetical protein
MYLGLPLAPIAQSAERLHGKEKVYGSIPYWGSDGGAAHTARPSRRCSSAWQSKRLIIAVSPVQIRPPLPRTHSRFRRTSPVRLPLVSSCPPQLVQGRHTRGHHRRPSQDHDGLHGVQGAELHHEEEPPQRPGSARAQEVLPALPQAHAAPRDALRPRRPPAATSRPYLRPPLAAGAVFVLLASDASTIARGHRTGSSHGIIARPGQ